VYILWKNSVNFWYGALKEREGVNQSAFADYVFANSLPDKDLA